MNRVFLSTKKRLQQRGSALLASLMVIVGLSLLGLGFVAISETESAISLNERNHTETVALAESGARLAVEWFQNPDKMLTLNLMPANNDVLKTQRVSGAYTGYYKADTGGEKLCDLPFGPLDNDKLFGAEDSADVLINGSTNVGQTFLTNLNTRLLGPESTIDPYPAGEITEIRIYAPPLVGATLTPAAAPHFFVGGTRYGVATIMVRTEKFDRPGTIANRRSVARAECRVVVSQFPLPTPGGPLQSSTNLATNGNFNVHWGMVSAQMALDLKKDYSQLPWFNAYDKIQFQRGYDSSVEWIANTAYRVGDVIRPKPATITANPLLRYHEYTVTVAGNCGGTEPVWPTTQNQTVALAGVTYRERQPTAYPLSTGGGLNATNTPWLYFIGSGNVAVSDPWFQARTAQNEVGAPNNNGQPWTFPFANPANSITPTGNSVGGTHHFQYQNFNQYPNYKELIFPIINYDFWKAAAIAGNNNSGVKYLQWVSADQYTDGVSTKTFVNWATSQPGFYFFETQNNQNPQNGGPGILAPNISTNNIPNYMSSFIYLNAGFGTTGQGGGGPDGWFNEPGEPYLDIGYREVETQGGNPTPVGDFKRDASGIPVIIGAVNNVWDYQDLPWSNTGAVGGGTADGIFNVYVAQRTVHDPSDTANPNSTYTGWFPVPYRPGCLPGNNSCGTCNCSEPHEPYLNVKYNGAVSGISFGWFDPATAVTTMRLPKKTVNGLRTPQTAANKVTCTTASSINDCTSNAYDLDGSLAGISPITDGVFFMEGAFTSTGNAYYYGSVLVGQGGVNVKGTPDIYYDESLSRGIRLPGFPRVMVTSIETGR